MSLLTRLLPWLVFAISLAATYQLWKNEQYDVAQDLQTRFDFRVRELAAAVNQRMLAYEQILRGARGFISASGKVSRQDFRAYVAMLQLEENYPGIQGVGFSALISAAQKAEHVAAVRREGFPAYAIKPEGERAIYAPVIYLEPFQGRNLRAFGYDTYSEPVRRAGMELARDTGRAAISGKVTLVQETDDDRQAGFLMYLPVFGNATAPDTLAARRAGIVGWVYAPFRMNDLMSGILGERAAEINVEIYDGAETSAPTLLFDAGASRFRGAEPDPRFHRVKHLDIAGRTWTIAVNGLSDFEANRNTGKPQLIAIAGIGTSIMLTLLVWLLLRGREQARHAAQLIDGELIEREARYRQMFVDNASIAFLIDPDAGCIVEANAAAAAFWGYTLEELRGKDMAEINIAPREKILAGMREVRDGATRYLEWRHRLKSGEVRDIEVICGPLAYRGKTLLYSILHDVTERKQVQQALRDSEERWNSALAGVGDGVLDWDIERGEVVFSKRCHEMLGYAENEIGTRLADWDRRVHPEDRPGLAADVQACLDGRKAAFANEHRVRCKDGSWKWILARGTVIGRDAAGKPRRMICTRADISETKLLAEKLLLTEKLQQSHDLLAKLSQQVPGVLYQYRQYPDGRSCLPFCSDEILEIFEVAPAEVQQDAAALFAVLHPEDRGGFAASLHESAELLQLWQHEFRVLLPQQGLRWRLGNARPERLADGSVLWHGFITDITTRKQIEQALQESEFRWKFALEGAGDGLWDMNIQTGEVVFSKRWKRMYGYAEEEIGNSRSEWEKRVHPEDMPWVQADLQAYFAGKTEVFSNKHRILCKDGRWKWILSRGLVVSRDAAGKPLRMIGTHSDISAILEAEQRTQELLRQNRSLMRNLFGLQERERSHLSRELHDELGQWLTAIQAEAEAICTGLHGKHEARTRASAQAIKECAAEVQDVIRRLVHRLRPSLLDILGLTESLQELVQQWREHNPQVRCDLILNGDLGNLSETLNITVYRIVQEILTNVAKHAQARQVTVELSRSATTDLAGETLLLTATDDGAGMDCDAQRRGLGLLGMRERVIAADGAFSLASAFGRGVRIEIRLPLQQKPQLDGKQNEPDTPVFTPL